MRKKVLRELDVERPLLVSVVEAAHILGIGREATYTLVREGRLRALWIGRRRVIPRTEIDAFIEREFPPIKGGRNGR